MDFLLSGLPDCLVWRWILPRFQWYERPRLRLISTHWREAVDSIRPEYTRQLQRFDYSSSYVLAVSEFNLLLLDGTGARKLPPLPWRHVDFVAACSGKVLAFFAEQVIGRRFDVNRLRFGVGVCLLDVSAGKWKWEQFENLGEGIPTSVTCFSACPDSAKVVFCTYNMTVKVFDAAGMEWLEEAPVLGRIITQLQQLPGDQLIATFTNEIIPFEPPFEPPERGIAIFQVGSNTWRDVEVNFMDRFKEYVRRVVLLGTDLLVLVGKSIHRYDNASSEWKDLEMKLPEGFDLEDMFVSLNDGAACLHLLVKNQESKVSTTASRGYARRNLHLLMGNIVEQTPLFLKRCICFE